ncbi:MAG: GNAT family N-acetyltransferase [Acidobacteriaceae bacterium]|nr:GNAT family N-acetyltransferase [Acidobacteriaceae bacterium]
MPEASQLEILDVRSFSGPQLAPLLRDEAARWQRRLRWDYVQAINLLLEYLDGRVLPGLVALRKDNKQLLGYCFCVYEGSKAVIGDIYAFGESEARNNPVCETLLEHMLEMLQNTPGIDRIESQLLMFPAGSFPQQFPARGFRSFPRLFLLAELNAPELLKPAPPLKLSSALRLDSWKPEFQKQAAELIHRAYIGHEDSQINDQYQSVSGAERFLHNIIRFPGCGNFDAENSLVLHDRHTGTPQAILLCSRIRFDTAHITQLCVTPSLRGFGLGHLLLTHCAQNLRERGLTHASLTVTESNVKARKLYEKLGFGMVERFEAQTWNAEQRH